MIVTLVYIFIRRAICFTRLFYYYRPVMPTTLFGPAFILADCWFSDYVCTETRSVNLENRQKNGLDVTYVVHSDDQMIYLAAWLCFFGTNP